MPRKKKSKLFDSNKFWQEARDLIEGTTVVVDPQWIFLRDGEFCWILINTPEEDQPNPPTGNYNLLATFIPAERDAEHPCWPDERWFVLVGQDGAPHSALTNRRGQCWIKNVPAGEYTPSLLTPVEYRERYGEPVEAPDDPETEEIIAGLRQLLNPEMESRRRRKPLGHWPLG